jgi:hypothetical protein
MNEIEFLNIDLDIESKVDISPIVDEFGDRVSVHRNEHYEGQYCVSFENGYMKENEIIEEYVSLVDGLSPRSKKIWDSCSKREFDFGYNSGETPNNFHSKISANSINSLAKVGGSVVITIYPIQANTEQGN